MAKKRVLLSFLDEPGLDPYSPPPEEFGEDVSVEQGVEKITEWFYANFENPVENTGYNGREGGYQYVWGPYSTRDIIENIFADAASEEIIKEAIDELDGDSDEWVPSQARIQPPDEEPPEDSQADVLHGEMLQKIAELEKALEGSSAVHGIGHNNPPEAIDFPFSQTDQTELIAAFEVLKAQPVYPTDNGDAAKQAAEKISSVGSKIQSWLAKQADNFVTEAVKKVGATSGIALVAYLADKLINLGAIVTKWLALVIHF